MKDMPFPMVLVFSVRCQAILRKYLLVSESKPKDSVHVELERLDRLKEDYIAYIKFHPTGGVLPVKEHRIGDIPTGNLEYMQEQNKLQTRKEIYKHICY